MEIDRSLRDQIAQLIEEGFEGHPLHKQITEMTMSFSPNGRVAILAFLSYAQEDGVLDQAWRILQGAWESHFQHQHSSIRGDIDLNPSNEMRLRDMMREAGVRWPRPDRHPPEPVDTSTITRPEDPELVAKLEVKAEEYRGRLSDPESESDARHKLAVLAAVLNQGAVDTATLGLQLSQEPWFDSERFNQAIEVIAHYCLTPSRS